MIVRICTPLLFILLLLQACDFGGGSGGGTGAEGLTGSLVDSKGSPVAGATVRLYATAEAALPALEKAAQASVPADSTVTRADGSFRFAKLSSGRYNLEASVRRQDTVLAAFARGIDYAGVLQRGKDTLRIAGDLRIRVLASGLPVTGAQCFVPASPYASVSDTSGTCKLTGVAPGLYEVGVSGEGFGTTFTDTLEVKSGATTEGASILGAPGSALSSGRGVNWTAKTSGTTVPLNGATWAGGQFAVVGNFGTVLLSTDGSTWNEESTSRTNHLSSVLRTDVAFLATGTDGVFYASPAGVTWTAYSSTTVRAVAWDGGTVLGVGNGGVIRTASGDGTGWSTVASGANPINRGIIPDFTAVTWTGSQFVAVGRAASDSAGVIYTSPHWSVAWTLRHQGTPSTPLSFVARAGGKLIAGGPDGRLLTSPDGVAWAEAPPAPYLEAVAWIGDRLVGVGQDASGNTAGVWTSADGTRWTRRYTGPPGSFLQSLAVSDSVIVAVGWNGLILTSP